ncbi:hypothetical protein H7097_03795 [Aeromicrobium sp.]|nr:hypothetical protein [Candidatus Saccharibacteria bacterium]
MSALLLEMVPSPKRTMYALILAGALGIGALKGCENVHAEAELSITDLAAGIESVKVIDDTCIMDVVTNIQVAAEYKQKGSFFPPSPPLSWKEAMDARMGNKVCLQTASRTRSVGDDNKIHLGFDDRTKFTTYVYPADPLADVFTSTHNFAAGTLGAAEEFIGGIPLPAFVKKDAAATLKDSLQNIDRVVAAEVSAEDCVPVAFDEAKAILAKNMINSAVRESEQHAEENNLNQSLQATNFVVDFPEHPIFASQYTGNSDRLKANEGLKITTPELSSVECTPSTQPVSNDVPAGAVG